jgi:hypothetical protein
MKYGTKIIFCFKPAKKSGMDFQDYFLRLRNYRPNIIIINQKIGALAFVFIRQLTGNAEQNLPLAQPCFSTEFSLDNP